MPGSVADGGVGRACFGDMMVEVDNRAVGSPG